MFERVIIWGHKLHTHTHSYIHYGFYKAFKHLNYDVYWLDEDDIHSELHLEYNLLNPSGFRKPHALYKFFISLIVSSIIVASLLILKNITIIQYVIEISLNTLYYTIII